ncbi:hypothetical protein KFK09_000264 [Dendrobium nobile]|uniref:Uncharacterized protein n=1 Tax=Dendrobium nobile TaxID=94219 RepID=A0A8T3CAL1_DENNO|nr:hypothetical protein KFK09_000264 [Dendrobium nobile]
MDLKPREIIGQIEAKFNIKVAYMKVWDAIRKALKIVFGSLEGVLSNHKFVHGRCCVFNA